MTPPLMAVYRSMDRAHNRCQHHRPAWFLPSHPANLSSCAGQCMGRLLACQPMFVCPRPRVDVDASATMADTEENPCQLYTVIRRAVRVYILHCLIIRRCGALKLGRLLLTETFETLAGLVQFRPLPVEPAIKSGMLSIAGMPVLVKSSGPLIPKERSMKKFRPISLLNCSFKIFTKVITNRLASVINRLISYQQSAFIKGRFIL